MENVDFLKGLIENSTIRIVTYILIIVAIYLIYQKYSEGFDNIPYHPTIDRMPEMGSLTNPVDTYIPGLRETHPVSFYASNRKETFKNKSDPLVSKGNFISLGQFGKVAPVQESFVTEKTYDVPANTLNQSLPGLNQEISKAPKVEGGVSGTPIIINTYNPDKDNGIINKKMRKIGK